MAEAERQEADLEVEDATKQQIFDAVIAYFESVRQRDPAAVSALLNVRIPCNRELANHPTCEIGVSKAFVGYRLGVLGLINGLMRTMGLPEVAAQFDYVSGLPELTCFSKYKHQQNPESAGI